jgi:hypothetical protein
MKLFGFILAVVGIPFGIAIAFQHPLIGTILTVLQIPNLVRGIFVLRRLMNDIME